ncbi:MAG: hypothetical protein NTV07_05550, partial [Candidatus Omnitrophica bacterium]|nr:hypothetical protein [Candidatus Omnitrophota bacterium]
MESDKCGEGKSRADIVAVQGSERKSLRPRAAAERKAPESSPAAGFIIESMEAAEELASVIKQKKTQRMPPIPDSTIKMFKDRIKEAYQRRDPYLSDKEDRQCVRRAVADLKNKDKILFKAIVISSRYNAGQTADKFALGFCTKPHWMSDEQLIIALLYKKTTLGYAWDLLEYLAKIDKELKTNLVAEYLIHEALEGYFSHNDCRLRQRALFPENYPAAGSYRGLLREYLREFINEQAKKATPVKPGPKTAPAPAKPFSAEKRTLKEVTHSLMHVKECPDPIQVFLSLRKRLTELRLRSKTEKELTELGHAAALARNAAGWIAANYPGEWPDAERQVIMEALRMSKGDAKKAAQYAGVSLVTLYIKIGRYHIEPEEYAAEEPEVIQVAEKTTPEELLTALENIKTYPHPAKTFMAARLRLMELKEKRQIKPADFERARALIRYSSHWVSKRNPDAWAEEEKKLIIRALKETNGRIRLAANRIGIHHVRFYDK